jgi:hypothetical protein
MALKLSDLKKQMRRHSIVSERKTTVTNAFVAAIAPVDDYDPVLSANAMTLLGQGDLEHLTCVYCGKEAETWDHLFPLVRDRRPTGDGSTLGNLVPCCKNCNSLKRNNDWKKWAISMELPREMIDAIERYSEAFSRRHWTYAELRESSPALVDEYFHKLDSIVDAFATADELATQIRIEAGRIQPK